MLDVRFIGEGPDWSRPSLPIGTALEVVSGMADLSIFTRDLPESEKVDAYMVQTLGILRDQGVLGPTLLLGSSPGERAASFLSVLQDLGLIEVSRLPGPLFEDEEEDP